MSAQPLIELVGNGFNYRIRLGNGPSKLVGGGATINEAARPEQSSLSDFAGNPLIRVDLPVYFDGFEDGTNVNQTHRIRDEAGSVVELAGVQEVLELSQGGPKGQFLPAFKVYGELGGSIQWIPYPHLEWLLELPDWGDGVRGETGDLIRQELVLHLIQFNNPQADVPRVHKRVEMAVGPGHFAGPGHVVTLKRNETLLEVSVTYFGTPAEARNIGKLNSIRDIRTILPVGQKLRIPQGK